VVVSCVSLFGQNLGSYREIVCVPREHVGEFRSMNVEQANVFWGEVLETTKRLMRDFNMRDVAFEISYGDWIVHRDQCPHYHAHVHILCSNTVEVLQCLKDADLLNCNINSRDKVVAPEDTTVKLPFTPNLETNKWNKFPLFTCINDWFGKLQGFVLRIELKQQINPLVEKKDKKDEITEENKEEKNVALTATHFSYEYFIRTSSRDSSALQQLLKSPPKGLRVF